VSAVVLDLAALAPRLRQVTVEVRGPDGAGGSGVLWPAGHVTTNAHVVRQRYLTVALADERELEAEVVALDRAADLALLRIPGSGLVPAALGESRALRVGTLVVAVGHPLGVRGALVAGIVHAVAPLAAGGRPWIQADLHLAPGNSGGPLADASGRVVGINAMIVNGLAFAVPMREVERFVRRVARSRPRAATPA
jgi:serine protease Do